MKTFSLRASEPKRSLSFGLYDRKHSILCHVTVTEICPKFGDKRSKTQCFGCQYGCVLQTLQSNTTVCVAAEGPSGQRRVECPSQGEASRTPVV